MADTLLGLNYFPFQYLMEIHIHIYMGIVKCKAKISLRFQCNL